MVAQKEYKLSPVEQGILKRALAVKLEDHRGKENAITGKNLTKYFLQNGFGHIMPERLQRAIRICIWEFRNDENIEKRLLINSTGGKKGGYWLATSKKSVYDFAAGLEDKAKDLFRTAKHARETADYIFEGQPNQVELF